MAHVPGLRSPYDEVGGIVYFGRMLDKIRLHARGALPADYLEVLGGGAGGFDERCCTFLRIGYEALRDRVLADAADAADGKILAWVFEKGREPSAGDILIWNSFMSKRGWRDEVRDRLIFRMNEAGLPMSMGVETMFDFLDADEGRPVRQFP